MSWVEVNTKASCSNMCDLVKRCGFINIDSKIACTIIPDDFSDGDWGKQRKLKRIEGFMIVGSPYIRVHYGKNVLNIENVKSIYFGFHSLASRFDIDLGLKKRTIIDVYISGSGLHPIPEDIKSGGRQGSGSIIICEKVPLSCLAHELSHVMMEPVVDRSDGFEETIADFFYNLYTPSDDDLYNSMIAVNCKLCSKNIWSRSLTNYENGRPYDLEAFWYFVVGRVGLDKLIKMIFVDKLFLQQSSVVNIWATLATYWKISVVELVIQYVQDTICGMYFRDDGPRFKKARKKLGSFYGDALVWRNYCSIANYDKPDFVSRGLELYGFEVHSLPMLFNNTTLVSCDKISVVPINKDDSFRIMLVKRKDQKLYVMNCENMVVSLDESLNKNTKVSDISLMLVVVRCGGTDVVGKYRIVLS